MVSGIAPYGAPMEQLALGCAPHTGWAVVVLVAGDARRPVVLDRRRVVLCPEDQHRQIYHHAQPCRSPRRPPRSARWSEPWSPRP